MVMLLAGSPALALVEFKDGLTHDINYIINDQVRVDWQTPSMYTTVNLLPGGGVTNNSLNGYQNSRINVQGGSARWLSSFDSSQVCISDGWVESPCSYGYSHVDVTGGSIGRLYSCNSSQVDISNGSLNRLYAEDSSRVNISGGSINVLWATQGVTNWASSQVNISGGSVGDMYIHFSCQVNISGGSINGAWRLWMWGVLTISGSDFAVDGQPVGYGELTSIFGGYYGNEPPRHLTGTLAGGEPIDSDFYIGQYARIILIPPPQTIVVIDIKPGSFPNSINPDSQGVIPVAILTTSTEAGEPVTFDASTVAAQTVRFGPGEAAAVQSALEDVDGDGDVDMVLHFRTQQTGIAAGMTEATLTGETTEGENIIGTDSVRIVPPEGKSKK